MPRCRGTVHFFKYSPDGRGYGFFWIDGSTERVFCSQYDLDGHCLAKNDAVEFDVVTGLSTRGALAQNIVLVVSSTMGERR